MIREPRPRSIVTAALLTRICHRIAVMGISPRSLEYRDKFSRGKGAANVLRQVGPSTSITSGRVPEACLMPQRESAKNAYFRRTVDGCWATRPTTGRNDPGMEQGASHRERRCPYCSNVLLADLRGLG